MINIKEQEELLKLITDYLEEDLICVAIGGTAMMFSGYKNTTKDIDLVFKNSSDRDIFIRTIKMLGYSEKSLTNVYDEKRAHHKNKPLLFTRGNERFDLFVKNIFGYELDLDKVTQRRDFLGKKKLTILVLSKEEIFLLKAITSREKDFEDMVTILKIEETLNWDLIIDLALKQKDNNSWILIDLEETLRKFKVPEKHLVRLYNLK